MPSEFVLVPSEATDDMLNAAHAVPRCAAKDGTDCGYKDVWKAMLDAAPKITIKNLPE